jgi:hypothetical protein
MSIMSETYYLGHDDEIRDQDILDRVVRELCKVNLNPSVSVNTKKEDNSYTSEIKITYDSDDSNVDDYDMISAVSNAMNYFRGGTD